MTKASPCIVQLILSQPSKLSRQTLTYTHLHTQHAAMQSSIRVSLASRTAVRTSVRCNAVKPEVCLLLLLFKCTRRASANQTHNSFDSYLLCRCLQSLVGRSWPLVPRLLHHCWQWHPPRQQANRALLVPSPMSPAPCSWRRSEFSAYAAVVASRALASVILFLSARSFKQQLINVPVAKLHGALALLHVAERTNKLDMLVLSATFIKLRVPETHNLTNAMHRNENRKEIKEQLQRVREGKEEPKF